MAVTAVLDEVKVVLKLSKGAQTISKCKKDATDEAYFTLAQAVGALQAEAVKGVTKIEQTTLSVGK